MDFYDALYKLKNQARKDKNAAALVYYGQLSDCVAFQTWETFKDSWAGGLWLKKNKLEIESFAEEQKRRFFQNWKTI